ncbi:MAG: thymidylate synthase [Candidatus Paceibacterota bacterium]
MKTYRERTPDSQYRDALAKIMKEGREVKPIHGEKALMLSGVQLRYNLDNGFPLIPDRDLGKLMKGALSEHFAFLHGARTQKELEEWGCKWWSRWVTPEKCKIFGLEPGDLGPGSYGPAWAAFPTAEGKPFNQILEVVKQVKERPYLRTHIITPWIPQYTIQHSELTRKVVVAPCHGYIHILAFPETKEVSVHHFQRSGDMPVGVPFNMIQYAAFTLMIAQILDYTPVEYLHTISDAHIYESQFSYVEELLKREPRRLPTVTLDPTIKEILDFRPGHFTLTDYEPHEAMTVPTPV